MLEQGVLHVYTDGSSFQHPRRGGCAALLVYLDDENNEQTRDYQDMGSPGATNNQMELSGCIHGLGCAVKFDGLDAMNRVIVFTDSMYVVDNYKNAIYVWPKTKWMGREGPILNVDRWKELVKKIKQLASMGKQVDIKWVKGHHKSVHNKAVDAMAKASAKGYMGRPAVFETVRRKQFKSQGKPSVVKADGQKFTIKIYACKLTKPHNLFRCKFEVVSKKSEFYMCQGVIYYKEALRTRHSYYVTLSSGGEYPTIAKIHRVYESKTDET